MLSFRSILFAAAAFAAIVSAVPTTPDVSSGLVQPSPDPPTVGGGGLSIISGLFNGLLGRDMHCKRGGQSSSYEIVKKCHDDIAVIVIKIG